MRVRALSPGYDNIAFRDVGDEFDMPDDAEAHWFEPVDPKARKKKGAAADATPTGTDLS